jgi:hypothetical protein
MAARRKQFFVVIDDRSSIQDHYGALLWFRPDPGRSGEAPVFRCDRVDASHPHYLVLEGLRPSQPPSPPTSRGDVRLWIAHAHVQSIVEDSAGESPRPGFV